MYHKKLRITGKCKLGYRHVLSGLLVNTSKYSASTLPLLSVPTQKKGLEYPQAFAYNLVILLMFSVQTQLELCCQNILRATPVVCLLDSNLRPCGQHMAQVYIHGLPAAITRMSVKHQPPLMQLMVQLFLTEC